MRGRKLPKPKPTRAPRRKYNLDALPRGYAPWRNNDPLVVLEQGPEQSLIRFLVNREDEFLPTESYVPNSHFKVGNPPTKRVKLKTKRVVLRVKLKRSVARVALR